MSGGKASDSGLAFHSYHRQFSLVFRHFHRSEAVVSIFHLPPIPDICFLPSDVETWPSG
jgi:hypothetical protein